MSHLAPSASAIAAPAAPDAVRPAEGRLPMGQSVLLVVTLSLGLWTGIGLMIHWAIG